MLASASALLESLPHSLEKGRSDRYPGVLTCANGGGKAEDKRKAYTSMPRSSTRHELALRIRASMDST